ncbi:unnamed protein product [Symbiodinium sp. CCMP2456]|nr:unnamed protein product [Symbiodinium sp. CCMP2456]
MRFLLIWLFCQALECLAVRSDRREFAKEKSVWRSDFAETKVVLWTSLEDATFYMLYELAAAHLWAYQEFRPNVQAIFSNDARFNEGLMGEMVINELFDHRSSFRSQSGDVYLIVASSKYSPGDDSFTESLLRWGWAPVRLKDFIVHCYLDSGGDAQQRNPEPVARAMAVEWNGKSFSDYNVWIVPVPLMKQGWLTRDYQRGSSREATVMEVADEVLISKEYSKEQLSEYMVQSIQPGPARFDYKIGLLGGNGPIAGAFAVMMVAETLLKATGSLGHVGLELFSQSQHPMSGAEAVLHPLMVQAYMAGLNKFLTRKDIDIFGCASNTWYQNLYAPNTLSWGMAVLSGFRMVHMPRATVQKATQCLHRSRLGMIATHWTHRAGRREGEVDADGFLLNGTGILERGAGIGNVYATEVQEVSKGGAVIISANVDTAWDAIIVAKHGDIKTAKKLFMDQKVEKIQGLGVPEHFGSANQDAWAAGRIIGNVMYIQKQQVDAIIGGCTEIGLALNQQDLDSISEPGSIAFVDSGAVMAEVLAKKALARGKEISLCDP